MKLSQIVANQICVSFDIEMSTSTKTKTKPTDFFFTIYRIAEQNEKCDLYKRAATAKKKKWSLKCAG